MNTIPAWCAIVCRSVSSPHVRRLVEALAQQELQARPLLAHQLVAACAGAAGPASPPGQEPVKPGGRTDPPLAILTRLASGGPPHELTALLPLEAGPWTWVNRPSAVARVHDKWVALCILAAAGLPVPPTLRLLRDDERTLDGLEGERFVVKPGTGAAGRGVCVGLTRSAALGSARAFADLSGAALVQPLLGHGIDRRLFMLDGKCVAAMERRPAAGDGRASSHYGGQAHPWEPGAADLELARRAAAALQLDVAGVDLLHEGGRSFVLEVNSCPGFTLIERATGRDVAGQLARLTRARISSR